MSELTFPPNLAESVKRIISEIELEMKRIGDWRAEPLPEKAFQFHQAFAMDTMTFTQWLQFVFIPRIHQILDGNGVFPTSSMVATQAIREFDGDERASKLVNLLIEFDQLFSNV
jgi:uncharacterized protein YqcC (DUF446 family)